MTTFIMTLPGPHGEFQVQVTYDETEVKQEIVVVSDDELCPVNPNEVQRNLILDEVGLRILERYNAKPAPTERIQ